jgi:hypothetical protein
MSTILAQILSESPISAEHGMIAASTNLKHSGGKFDRSNNAQPEGNIGCEAHTTVSNQ